MDETYFKEMKRTCLRNNGCTVPKVFALIAFLAAMSSARSESGDSHAFVERKLGPVPDPITIILSKDSRHAFYVVSKGDKKQVLFDGQPAGPEFDGIFVENSVTMSNDGKRQAYAIGKEDKEQECTTCGPQGKWYAAIDGQPGPEYDKISKIAFSPDGKSVAYGAIDKERQPLMEGDKDHWVLVRDGKETPLPYEAISRDSPAFTPDGKHLVYIAKKEKKAVVVVDGKEGKAYGKIALSMPVFSPDGHIAYTARDFDGPDRGSEMVILDGKPGPKFDNIPAQSLLFSPDGQRLAYGGQRGGVTPHDPGKWFVVVDGRVGPEYDQVDNLVFSPDGKHLAYKARKGDRWLLVVDDRPRPEHDDLAEGYPVFSPDGQRIAYGFKDEGKWKVFVEVLDGGSDGERGVIGGEFDRGVGLIAFSPDGRRLAFAGRNGESRMIVIDGEKGEAHDSIDHIVFSPDGKRVAYEAAKFYKTDPNKADTWFVVVDGEAKPSYEALTQGSLLFSADSKHVAYTATKDQKQIALVDDQAGPEYKAICHLWATAEGGFEAIAIGDNLYRMIWKP